MDKRLLLAVVVSMGILFLWWKIFPPTPAVAPVVPTAAQVETGRQPSKNVAGSTTPEPPAEAGGQPNQPAERPAEALVTLEAREANYVFSSWGASLRKIKLKDRQFLLQRNQPDSGMQIVSTATESTAPLRTTFTKADFSWPDDMAWSVSRPTASSVVFLGQTNEVAVEKRFSLDPQRYRLQFSLVVKNKSNKPLDHSLTVHLSAVQDPAKKGGGYFSYASANLAEVICHVNDKAKRATIDSLLKESQR